MNIWRGFCFKEVPKSKFTISFSITYFQNMLSEMFWRLGRDRKLFWSFKNGVNTTHLWNFPQILRGNFNVSPEHFVNIHLASGMMMWKLICIFFRLFYFKKTGPFISIGTRVCNNKIKYSDMLEEGHYFRKRRCYFSLCNNCHTL